MGEKNVLPTVVRRTVIHTVSDETADVVDVVYVKM